jgi:hypothetical protein
MTATATRLAYCPKCALPGELVGDTLDPRHPIVRCARTGRDGLEHGHGRAGGYYDLAEAQASAHRRHVANTTAHHKSHADRGRRHVDCLECDADPSVDRIAPHPYQQIRGKFRNAGHLDLAHHDRTLLSRLTLREPVELDRRHRELHGIVDDA